MSEQTHAEDVGDYSMCICGTPIHLCDWYWQDDEED